MLVSLAEKFNLSKTEFCSIPPGTASLCNNDTRWKVCLLSILCRKTDMIPVEDYAFQCIPPLSKCYKKYYLIIPPKLLLSTKSQNVIAIKSLLEKHWTPGIGPSSRHAIITDFVTDCLLLFCHLPAVALYLHSYACT